MKYLISLFIVISISCNLKINKPNRKVIVLQPFGDFPISVSTKILNKIKNINPNIEIRKNMPFPNNSYYSIRNRYRADTIIRFLKHEIGNDSVIVGLTNKDISTTKDGIKDWGVMGLGYRPGKSCVVSMFRLKNNKEEQFYKVVLHELGHTEGLPHCKEKTCFMRDAEGGNPLEEETCFCKECSNYLEKRGWNLHLANR